MPINLQVPADELRDTADAHAAPSPMTFVYEERNEGEGWGFFTAQFKTLRGATSRGCKRQRSSGYLAADEYIGEPPYRRHVVAQWKNARGEVVARVWT